VVPASSTSISIRSTLISHDALVTLLAKIHCNCQIKVFFPFDMFAPVCQVPYETFDRCGDEVLGTPVRIIYGGLERYCADASLSSALLARSERIRDEGRRLLDGDLGEFGARLLLAG